MFQNLSDKLQDIFRTLAGKGRLTEAHIQAAMKEVKLALLEADVNFKVVRAFVDEVSRRAVGAEVLSSLTPGQQVVKIVHEELVRVMGEREAKLELGGVPPHVILVAGLQGSGKTTFCGKLSRMLKAKGHKPLLVACDVYRPAAIRQLQVLGESLGVPVFEMGKSESPVEIAKTALGKARNEALDVVIVDTAGRLHVDAALMDELKAIRAAVNPVEVLLVVDAMTGQDAVNIAREFNDAVDVTGVVLTKLDGDTRGGAALSVRHVTGKPIKFVGVGEKVDALEPFHPDRLAGRILGMGDVLSLIEKAQANMDVEKAKKLEQRLREESFNFEDFRDQLDQLSKLGPLENLLGMLPGMSAAMKSKDMKVDPKELVKVRAMIDSMTVEERRFPHKINGSRRRRIARGSGTTVQDVNQLLRQFEETRRMMKQLGRGLFGGGKMKLKFPFFGG